MRTALVNVMERAARRAARGLVRDFGELESLQITKKGTADFVSNADKAAEAIIRDELETARPRFGFLMEESGTIEGSDPDHRWIVDPLDGTTNFLHGLPHFAISIALEHSGRIISGVIYDPIKDELFWAERGKGAFMNDRRLRVSPTRQLTESVLATGIPFAGRKGGPEFMQDMARVMPAVAGIRRFGAAALDLAYVAAGRYEGFFERYLSYWDIAAGILLVREAGGIVTDIQGGGRVVETGHILAANDMIHPQMVRLLKQEKT
ncbi:MAG: inositol monophosphatase [Alphaproteobacteria bacterium]|nr:inositol monophosphatase [Alphaproteobacteria bacterium]